MADNNIPETVVPTNEPSGSLPASPTENVETDMTQPTLANPADFPETSNVGPLNAQKGVQNAPGAPVSNQVAPQGQQQGQPKPQAPNQTATTPQQQPVHPSVQRASWVHDVAETLAGGPKYNYNVDPNTGEMKKTQVPVSGKHLALAIALEALQGSMTGLAAGRGKGPGAAGAAAMAQQQQQQQKIKEQAQREASDNYARGAAIAQTNMHMALNERTLAEADVKLHQRDVDTYAPIYDEAIKTDAVDREGLDEAEVHKLLTPDPTTGQSALNVSKDMIIPIRVRPKTNADGSQAKGTNGEPLYEKEYALLKPSAQIDLPPDVLKTLQDNKVPGYVDKDGKPIDLPTSYRPRLQLVIDGMEKARTIQTGQSVLKGLSQKQVNPLHSESGTQGQGGQPVSLKSPDLQNDTFTKFATDAANTNQIDPALVKAIIKQESNGDPKAVSKKGAQGLMQLMPKTAADMGLKGNDVFDPEKNIEAGTKYFKQLLDKYKGNTQEALAAYNAGSGNVPAGKGVPNIPETQNYVKNISDMTGLAQQTQAQTTSNKPALTDPQIQDMMKSLSPAQQTLLTQWQLFYDGGPEKASTMDKLTEPGPNGQPPRYSAQDVGTVKNLLNQVYPIDAYHQDVEQRKADLSVKTAGDKEEQKAALEQGFAEKSQSYLKMPENFQSVPNIMTMNPKDAASALSAQGVHVPPELSTIMAAMRYRVPLSENFPAKVYKGTPTISAQDATAFGLQFINPNFDQTNWKAAQKFRDDLTPGGKVGQNILQAGIASNHIELAEQALKNLNNRQLPVWNKIANEFQTQAGASEPKVYAAIADVLANEVGKVVSGGSQAYEAELKRFHDNLSTAQSPTQALGVLDAYVGLMNGRVNEVNDQKKESGGG